MIGLLVKGSNAELVALVHSYHGSGKDELKIELLGGYTELVGAG